jgi:hypothetical protein
MVKLSPLAHHANAHADSVWSVAWAAEVDPKPYALALCTLIPKP